MVVSVCPARADEQDISFFELHILSLSNLLQNIDGDGRSLEARLYTPDSLLLSPGFVVEKDASAYYTTVFHPHMDAVSLCLQDVFITAVVVISLLFLIPIMSKPVPLRRTLCVEGNSIVIHASGRFIDDAMVESNTVETWRRHFVQRPIDGDTCAVDDFLGCESGVLRGKEVEHAELVVAAPEAPGIAVRAFGVQREGGEGWACR